MRHNVSPDEIRRYLLGQAPAAASVSLEEMYIADPEFLADVELGEADLVDDYITGRLTAPDRERFERHYLTTPGHREEVALARALRAAAGTAAHQSASSLAGDATRASGRTFRWVGVAAVAILAIGIGVALRVGREPLTSDAGTTAPTPVTGGPTAPPATNAAVLRLSTDATRSDGRTPMLAIPTDVTHVELQFQAEPPIERRGAEVASVDGGVTWKGLVRPVTQAAADMNARVLIDRSAMTPGDYVLTVLSGRHDAVPERYYFRILP